jgi:hypothetical protein
LFAFRIAHSALIDRVPVTAGKSLVILGAVALAGGQEKCEFCRTMGWTGRSTIRRSTIWERRS